MKEMEDTSQPSLTNKQTITTKLTSYISRVCPILPKIQDASSMNLRKRLSAIKRILLFDDTKAVRKYSVTKTAVELARLRNEVQGYLAELESDFSEQESRTFEYAQMAPQNRFVTEVLRQKNIFMEKYDRCHELYNHSKLVQYRREKDETITYGRELLKEIEATYHKLPSSIGYGGL